MLGRVNRPYNTPVCKTPSQNTQKRQIPGTVRTQLASRFLLTGGDTLRRAAEGAAAMCANTNYGLTMDGLLNDPLTQLMMRSDGVTHEEHADLWERTRETAIARFAEQAPAWKADGGR